MKPYFVIDHPSRINRVVTAVSESDVVAVDTEADSLHSYPEKLCLVQISVKAGDFLVDPLAKLDPGPLLQELKKKELVLHGGDYDLRLLHRHSQFVPRKIFDTMTAARLLGETEFGLSRLLRKYLGVELKKVLRKANWSERPLTQDMKEYARNDTRHLIPLANLLRQQLVEKGRLSWLEECCDRIIADAVQAKEEDKEGIWRIRGSHRLDGRGLAILRELWHWREQEAVFANRPPYFILSHEKLVELARIASQGPVMDGRLPRRMGRQLEKRMMDALERGLQMKDQDLPPRRYRKSGFRPSPVAMESPAVTDLKTRRDKMAEELGIDPTLIASRAQLSALAGDWQNEAPRLMNWQRKLLEKVAKS